MRKKEKEKKVRQEVPNQVDGVSPRKMSKNSVKAAEHREQLYEAVAQVLLKQRKATFTLDEVASEIGVSKGVVYYYFHSKGELIYRLNKYMFGLIRHALEPISNDASLSPRRKLEALIKSYVNVTVNHWKISRLLWSDMALRETSAHHAGVINRERKAYRNLLMKVLKDITIAERLDPIDEHIAAWLIYGILSFSPMWFHPGGAITEEEMINYIIKLITEGFLTKQAAD
ncbi:MAG: TetR/AcrR family transcriptional regulator [Dehalococcoidia bacterium]|jgi:AcrR family transcriptional regulator